MIKIKVVLLSFLFCVFTKAQWVVQQVPTTNALIDVFFADTSQGWVTGRDGIFHTGDDGNTWDLQYQGNTSYLSGLSDTEAWATALGDTLLHTTNGGASWDIITVNGFTDFDSTWGLSTVYFYDSNIGWAQAEGWISGAIQIRLLKTTNGGVSWEMGTDPRLSNNALIQFFDLLYGYRTGNLIPIFRTADGGDTWEEVSWYGGYNATMSMQFLTKENGWISIDGPVLTTWVIKTTNGGENWFDILSFQCSDVSTYLSFVDTLTGWVVQWTCLYGGRTEIWHTSDGGTTWDLQFTYSPPFYFRPRQIFFVDSLNGWVVGENGVILHTSNGGIIPVELISFTPEVIENGVMLNWTTATETNNSGFEILRFAQNDNEWKTIGFVPGFGTTTEPKSYSFIDENVTTGVFNYRLKQIDFDGTFNFSEVIEVKVDLTPKELTLEQNYPNPFNSSTIIKYSLPEASNVTLAIYDILGTVIKVLVNEKKESGNYEVNIELVNLPSGIYLYRLGTDNITKSLSIVRKMVVIK